MLNIFGRAFISVRIAETSTQLVLGNSYIERDTHRQRERERERQCQRDSEKDTEREIKKIRRYVNIIIIIIMSCRQHGYPWPSLATSPDYSSPLAGPQGYILCPHIAAVCKFELVVLLFRGHMWGSIGVHHLWARPWFSSSALSVWFV